jgi:hypothetical protein
MVVPFKRLYPGNFDHLAHAIEAARRAVDNCFENLRIDRVSPFQFTLGDVGQPADGGNIVPDVVNGGPSGESHAIQTRGFHFALVKPGILDRNSA